MKPIIPAVACGLHVFLTCLNLPSFNIGFAFNAGMSTFWLLMFFEGLFRSPQDTSAERGNG